MLESLNLGAFIGHINCSVDSANGISGSCYMLYGSTREENVTLLTRKSLLRSCWSSIFKKLLEMEQVTLDSVLIPQ